MQGEEHFILFSNDRKIVVEQLIEEKNLIYKLLYQWHFMILIQVAFTFLKFQLTFSLYILIFLRGICEVYILGTYYINIVHTLSVIIEVQSQNIKIVSSQMYNIMSILNSNLKLHFTIFLNRMYKPRCKNTRSVLKSKVNFIKYNLSFRTCKQYQLSFVWSTIEADYKFYNFLSLFLVLHHIGIGSFLFMLMLKCLSYIFIGAMRYIENVVICI
eukprot:TRINITY_DN1377_c0_g2_i10.p1 TRINITY_DN1377_c0_g2~~TRINITY_DN1377_c0_g2_i10.p1  ORF type:complete len:214 (-),score=-20.52 TRINITY_DN1377_c0_g2_i10:80-721(-)